MKVSTPKYDNEGNMTTDETGQTYSADSIAFFIAAISSSSFRT